MARGADGGDGFSFDTELRGTPPAASSPDPYPVPDQLTVPLPIVAASPAPIVAPASAPSITVVETRAAMSSHRYQPLAWVVLGLALGSALLNGFSTYAALASEIDPGYVAAASDRLWGATVGMSCGVVAVALGIVAVVVSRPRVTAVVGAVAALTLPTIGMIIGLKLGTTALIENLGDQAEDVQTELIQLAAAGNEWAEMVLRLVQILIR